MTRRSKALAPLSRDHHHALVIAMALERAELDRAAQAAARFVEFLAGHELSHFALEEGVLLPAVPDGDPGEALVERVLGDHAYLREALGRLGEAGAVPEVGYLHEVGARLREHVRMEERELFPYLEEALEEIGRRLEMPPAGGDGE